MNILKNLEIHIPSNIKVTKTEKTLILIFPIIQQELDKEKINFYINLGII
ncbi:hypothetical protein [Buchnera aphidicola]